MHGSGAQPDPAKPPAPHTANSTTTPPAAPSAKLSAKVIQTDSPENSAHRGSQSAEWQFRRRSAKMINALPITLPLPPPLKSTPPRPATRQNNRCWVFSDSMILAGYSTFKSATIACVEQNTRARRWRWICSPAAGARISMRVPGRVQMTGGGCRQNPALRASISTNGILSSSVRNTLGHRWVRCPSSRRPQHFPGRAGKPMPASGRPPPKRSRSVYPAAIAATPCGRKAHRPRRAPYPLARAPALGATGSENTHAHAGTNGKRARKACSASISAYKAALAPDCWTTNKLAPKTEKRALTQWRHSSQW